MSTPSTSMTGKRTLLVQNDQGFAGFVLDHELRVRFASAATARRQHGR